MPTSSSKFALHSLQPLRNYIRSNLSRLRSAPCLLISSSPPTPSSSANSTKYHLHHHDSQIESHVQRAMFSIVSEFNLRTVPFQISSSYPTTDAIQGALSLATRAGLKGITGGSQAGINHKIRGGEGVVIGVGSGAAIDLAKAVSDSLFGNVMHSNLANMDDQNDVEEEMSVTEGGSLLLAPATLGGFMAATSNSPSLLLDTAEEVLIPYLAPTWRFQSGILHGRRVGTAVTLEQFKHLSFPPLSASNHITMSSGSKNDKDTVFMMPLTMAHVSAALLSIAIDVARSLDEPLVKSSLKNLSSEKTGVVIHLSNEISVMASHCSAVLNLAAEECASRNAGVDVNTDSPRDAAQKHLLESLTLLSPILHRASLLTSDLSISIGSTIPQTLVNALLPTYFPQCHLFTCLSSTFPGLCEALVDQATMTGIKAEEDSILQRVAHSILSTDTSTEPLPQQGGQLLQQLSKWASEMADDVGIPSFASLAFGTPDPSSFITSLDTYETVITSLQEDNSTLSTEKERWMLETILQKSLNR